MITKETGDKKVIELQGKKANTYSIISIILFIVLLLLCGFLLYTFQEKPVFAFGAMFIPLALAVFLLKVIIWNLFGTETLVIGQQDLRVFYDYKFIYRKVIKNYNFDKAIFKARSNDSVDLITIEAVDIDMKKKTLYKLHLDMGNDNYQSSFSINSEELARVKGLIRS